MFKDFPNIDVSTGFCFKNDLLADWLTDELSNWFPICEEAMEVPNWESELDLSMSELSVIDFGSRRVLYLLVQIRSRLSPSRHLFPHNVFPRCETRPITFWSLVSISLTSLYQILVLSWGMTGSVSTTYWYMKRLLPVS